MERRIDDQRPSAPLEWEAKYAAMDRETILDLAQVHLTLDNASRWIATDDEMVEFGKALIGASALHAEPAGQHIDGDAALAGLERFEPAIFICSEIGTGMDEACMKADSEGRYILRSAAIRALASQPAAPVQPAKGSPAEAWKGLADKAIDVLRRHIVPDGISDRAALDELYGIFDGPEYRAVADIEQDRCDARQQEAMAIDRSTANMMKIGKSAAPPVQQPGDVRDLIDAETMPKRTAFIKWIESRHLDASVDKDAWGAQIFKHSHIQAMWEGWFNAPTEALATTRPSAANPDASAKLLDAAMAFAKEHIEGDALHDDDNSSDDAIQAADDRYNETKRLLCDAYLELRAAPTLAARPSTALTDEVKAPIANLAAVVRVQNGNRHADTNSLIEHADRLLAASSGAVAVPEGYAIVPVEPTSKMRAAGVPLRMRIDNSIDQLYRAMIYAAPAIPAQGQTK